MLPNDTITGGPLASNSDRSAASGTQSGPSKKKKPTSSRVTRNIKGAKEIVIEIAALRGKGYPAPVNINA